MKVTLDFSEVTSRGELHDLLMEAFSLPEYYGRNLDALYDCLSEPGEDIEVNIISFDVLEERLGRYARRLRSLLRRVSSERPGFMISID